MKRLNIGCDLDDTIFGFTDGYIKRFKRLPNKDWAITRNVNNILSKERDFWIGLPVIRRPNFVPKLYCSSRVNKKCWTKKAIELNNLPNSPLYQIPGYNIPKYTRIKGRIDVFIDDSPYQWKTLNLAGVPTLLMDTPYNQDLGPIGRIYSLDYAEIEDAYNLFITTAFPEFNKIFNIL